LQIKTGNLDGPPLAATPDPALKSNSSGIRSEEAECRRRAGAIRAGGTRRDMTIDIEILRLVNFETATDGTAVKLIVADCANREIGIILKIETLTALLMTLPAMASSAVKRAHNDPNMRITYPLREFEIEFGPDNLRILTIGTPDGFKVSFSLTEDLSLELGKAHLDGAGQRAKTH
jgi:hypothetical protein